MTDSPNLRLVRSIYAGIEGGNYTDAAWADPGIEYVIAEGPEPGSFMGRLGMAEVMRNFFSAFDDVRDQAEEFRELDRERVLVLNRISGRGKISGIDTDQRGAQLFETRDGRVIRVVVWLDRERALADLGLAPDTGT